ncbi:MAG TPA: ABC transporter ATP-binding protein [Opitutales bacterium]|nr:ABC transporter ATP-binding protein [Opitutales bacterium]
MNKPHCAAVLMEARGVFKAYAGPWGAIPVLEGVDCMLHAGESVSIRGESGCGKTTLLNVLCGLETIDNGTVHWHGRTLTEIGQSRLAHERARKLGLIFQAFYLLGELSAFENVLLAKRLLGALTEADRKRAADLLERVGLGKRMKHMPAQLSGGERQRVAIARALMNAPQMILADEPTGNLDEKTAAHVMELLFELTRDEGVSLMLVTHNPDFARMASRGLVLQAGRLHPAR